MQHTCIICNRIFKSSTFHSISDSATWHINTDSTMSIYHGLDLVISSQIHGSLITRQMAATLAEEMLRDGTTQLTISTLSFNVAKTAPQGTSCETQSERGYRNQCEKKRQIILAKSMLATISPSLS